MFLRALIRRLTTDRVHDEFSASPKSEKATKDSAMIYSFVRITDGPRQRLLKTGPHGPAAVHPGDSVYERLWLCPVVASARFALSLTYGFPGGRLALHGRRDSWARPTPRRARDPTDGAVRSIDTTHSNLIMNVTSVTLPNGKPTSLAPARSKTIVFTVATRLTDWHGSRLCSRTSRPAPLLLSWGKTGGSGVC